MAFEDDKYGAFSELIPLVRSTEDTKSTCECSYDLPRIAQRIKDPKKSLVTTFPLGFSSLKRPTSSCLKRPSGSVRSILQTHRVVPLASRRLACNLPKKPVVFEFVVSVENQSIPKSPPKNSCRKQVIVIC